MIFYSLFFVNLYGLYITQKQQVKHNDIKPWDIIRRITEKAFYSFENNNGSLFFQVLTPMMKTSTDTAMMFYWFNEADGVSFYFKREPVLLVFIIY